MSSPPTVRDSRDPTRVDTRYYRDGRVRLRFRLSPDQAEIVEKALRLTFDLTGYASEAAALEIIFLSYLSGSTGPVELAMPVGEGTRRRLFKLYADQYELVRTGLDMARHAGCENDHVGLTLACLMFLISESE